jgi:2-phosphoglycerate kinase
MDREREREQQERRHLAQSDRHIAKMKKHIALQRVIVQNAINKGHPSIEAESLLKTFEDSLRLFERHRQMILDVLAKAKVPPRSK